MQFFSPRKKKHSKAPFTSTPTSGLASSQVTQQLQSLPQVPTYSQSQSQSQSHLQSPQGKQQSQPVCPWSTHTPPSGRWPSPFPRCFHALSTAATSAGELFLFGGSTPDRIHNDLYIISTRDFSTTLLNTSGDIPNPRYAHHAVLTSTTLLIWGGTTEFSDQNAQNQSDDDSFYLLNLVSRDWSRIVVDGPGPGRRYYHTMTLVGSKLFVFGGRTDKSRLNDIWALDLNCLESNPFWESYEPAPGNEKPLPRAGHVSVATGDRIIIFGGRGSPHDFNDTWSFNTSTRRWTELQCTGSIPSPRTEHAAVLVDGVMYVFSGHAPDETRLGDLSALNLSTQRWITFQDIGSSPCGRRGHAMAFDGRRVFVLGGKLSPGAQADEAKLIHVLDTKHLDYPEPDSDAVNPSEKTTQLVPKSSVNPFQKVTPEELDPFQKISREQNPSLNGLPSETFVAKTERDRRIAQLTDELALKSALLKQVAEEKKHARLEVHELQAKLDESLLSRDRAEADAAEAKKRAGLMQRGLQARLDELLLSRDQALEQAQSALRKATFRAAEANERSQPPCEHETELAEVHAKLEARESEFEAVRLRLMDAEAGWAKSKAEAHRLRAQSTAGLNTDTDVDQVVHGLMERVRAEMASRSWNEKSIESMECRNEG